jgi:crotonobetainyl-CoA:carnitine CoA-transferase CaiB-like acyl-CoA transferase
MSATPPEFQDRAPELGEHTVPVLAEAGYRDDEIRALLDAGAVGSAGHGPR